MNAEINTMKQKNQKKFMLLNSDLFISKKGFTLLELLISFALLGIIVVIITSALRLGMHTVDKGERKMNSLERVRTSMSIIDAQIQSQLPLKTEVDGEYIFYFGGGRDTMQFPTNYSIWGGKKGYVHVSYTVETDETGKHMLTASENVIGLEDTREARLFQGFDDISFEYFYLNPTEETGRWIDTWEDDLNIPEKVRLNISYQGKDVSMIIPMRSRSAVSGITVKKGGISPWTNLKSL
jgi:prepilin-type N-terminal cleavage/methylation domain-containing protein